MNDLELLPHMYAPLQLMFAEHCVEMELKAAHRERRRERRVSSPSLVPGTRHYSTDAHGQPVAMTTATPTHTGNTETNASDATENTTGESQNHTAVATQSNLNVDVAHIKETIENVALGKKTHVDSVAIEKLQSNDMQIDVNVKADSGS